MRLSAVVLAAGQGRRFGGDKLRADLGGKPVIHHVIDALRVFDFHETLAVVRPGQTIDGIPTIENPRAEDGMGTSLAVGIQTLGRCDGAFVLLGDMPFIPSGIFAQLAQSLPDHDIVVPRHNGQAGHPVLFSAVCFAELSTLDSDRGGRSLIASGRYRVAYIDVLSSGVLRDIDTPEDLKE